ncbi:unnamed protein product [Haemonchus placei]|uniref:Histone acetyltransferase n=1 Tax=Haemonchus placei TaxID=6290 RepID=A0A0N4WL80_HAEPC|nr:unnamed protein product [Haemonchus placei]
MDDEKSVPTNIEEKTPSLDDVKINERVVVWRLVNGEKRRVLATLLKKRGPDSNLKSNNTDEGELDQKLNSLPLDESTDGVENQEFFVHFDGQDRRLDQWISREQYVNILCAHPDNFLSIFTTIELRPFFGTPPEKNIERIIFGSYEIQCWYYSPYRLKNKLVERLLICENCLLYTEDRQRFACHLAKDCKLRNPPGEAIYEEGDIKVYEVFGALQKFYCQRLCLLAKLFIDHKTLCFDVENFIFYLLCEVSLLVLFISQYFYQDCIHQVDNEGTHIAAMFSKEMYSSNNLACIMTLPCYQRKGYGSLMIQLSYEMSKRAKYPGTPERPFSDLGEISYKKYWLWVLLQCFDSISLRKAEDVTLDELEVMSGISKDDIKDVLEPIGLVSHLKGGTYIVHNPKLDQESGVERPNPPLRMLNPKCLIWNAKTFDRPKRRN